MKDLYEKTVKCIRCGFCLEACPTFVITGEETESPRGRIYLVRSAIEGEVPWRETLPHLDACLGCRACETACPSGVEYGAILEMARAKLEADEPRRMRSLLLAAVTGKAARLLARLPVRRVPRLFSREKPQAELPRRHRAAPVPQHENAGTKGEIALLRGCAMDTYFAPANDAARWLLERQGYSVVTIRDCCGALHSHSGKAEAARRMLDAIPKNTPIAVTSAGCGSHLKDHGIRARDLSELLHEDFQPPTGGQAIRIAYQDACHLLHGQRVAAQPRAILDSLPGVERVEIDNTCCGSAGIYNITQPTMARKLLEKKWQAIEQARVEVVVSANPGCLAWISQAAREKGSSVRVVHFASFVAERCHNKQA